VDSKNEIWGGKKKPNPSAVLRNALFNRDYRCGERIVGEPQWRPKCRIRCTTQRKLSRAMRLDEIWGGVCGNRAIRSPMTGGAGESDLGKWPMTPGSCDDRRSNRRISCRKQQKVRKNSATSSDEVTEVPGRGWPPRRGEEERCPATRELPEKKKARAGQQEVTRRFEPGVENGTDVRK